MLGVSRKVGKGGVCVRRDCFGAHVRKDCEPALNPTNSFKARVSVLGCAIWGFQMQMLSEPYQTLLPTTISLPPTTIFKYEDGCGVVLH